jgi:putative ABC transport system substrate-binding protein
MIRRRDVFTLLGGAAAAWPVAAQAQQSMPVVGFLDSGARAGMDANLTAFLGGLREMGLTEGRNVVIEYRWAEGQYNRLPMLAAELINRPVAVIAATRSSAPALAAKAKTSAIPIVFQTGTDPVKDGLVASLNRPGGNVTGATRLTTALTQKRLGLMTELLPKATAIALLANPLGPQTAIQVSEIETAAQALRLKTHIVKAASEGELNTAFADAVQGRCDAMVVASDNLFITRGGEIAALAMRHKIPVMTFESGGVKAGILMSYAASLAESFAQVGAYAGRILKGEKPSDLPVLQPTKFDLVLNLKTAKAIGLTIPDKLMALADEVIE